MPTPSALSVSALHTLDSVMVGNPQCFELSNPFLSFVLAPFVHRAVCVHLYLGPDLKLVTLGSGYVHVKEKQNISH